MEPYKNLDGDSGIVAYEIGDDWIKVAFRGGAVYLYNYDTTGQHNVEQMKILAVSGTGLNAFINTNVRKAYAAKMS